MSPRFEPQRGNAPAEFVLVSALLVALAVGVIHTTLIIHVRHILQASAWEGARLASYYDTTSADGISLTRGLISDSLNPRYATDVRAQSGVIDGQPAITIIVAAPVPTLGLWSLGGEIRVEARAALEQPG